MPRFSDLSSVGRVGASTNAFINALLPSQAAFRLVWSSKDAGGTTQISYSFPWADGAASQFTSPYGRGENTAAVTVAVSSGQAAMISRAFDAWADIANISFTKVAETADGTVGDIRIAITSAVSAGYWGYSLGVSDGRSNAHGDIWIDKAMIGQSFAPGTYNYMAMLHEIGHSLGLKHPFETPKIPAGYDNQRYTIMSYTSPEKVWWTNPATGTAEFLVKTPMVYDIQAIQALYGANMKTRTGDDTYAFNPAAPSFEAIWDAGGTDTFSVAAFSNGCTVDLNPGAYSSLAYNGVTLTNNIGIAFRCNIENALGGSGGDTLLGNQLDNTLDGGAGGDTLRGNAGNDTLLGRVGNDLIDGGAGNDALSGGENDDVLIGGAGNDTLDGGAGSDTASFATGSAAVRVSLAITGAQATGGAGIDTLTGIENLIGGTGADILIGDGGANVIDGGNGADQLSGGGGADVLIGGGGRDILAGGEGGDVFRFASIKELSGATATNADVIVDFNRAHDDRIDLSGVDAIKQTAAVNDAFTWIGSAAFSKVAGQLRYAITNGVGLVSGDIDGNGTADFAIRIDGGPALVAADFIL
ncbi:M10 family metallopeptidase C-terminal domain-containing protein [Novosphingobium sp.]|uniref:M10 family metallopeptidase C-terminal domain-containing protein n=1 Tax=Novosphingobium sp. TaxID=1874826 RepID=UPI001D9D7C5A|nr:M10 family metallopeptidase C-terminal domain-containing protein [Novosphingobium sp.]MBX9665656.1 M10 family metallopeptidase C-terminal domain-containing protein [Novosphingobium sp.]